MCRKRNYRNRKWNFYLFCGSKWIPAVWTFFVVVDWVVVGKSPTYNKMSEVSTDASSQIKVQITIFAIWAEIRLSDISQIFLMIFPYQFQLAIFQARLWSSIPGPSTWPCIRPRNSFHRLLNVSWTWTLCFYICVLPS